MSRALAPLALGLALLGPSLAGCTVIPASDPESTGKAPVEVDTNPANVESGDPSPTGPDDEGEDGSFIPPQDEAENGEAPPPEGGGEFKVVAGTVPCSADSDCVPDACCHPTQCVAAAQAKDCSATSCTMDCKAETMTCGGGCLCQDGVCAAKLWMGP